MALPSGESTALLLFLFAVLVRVVPGLGQLEGSDHVIPTVAQRSLQDTSSYPGYDEYSWMWGDAGTHLLGHTLAEVDFLRWSEWKNSAATIRDLEASKNPHNSERPVEMIGMNGRGEQTEIHPGLQAVTQRPRMRFTNMDAAIRYLNMHKASYSWMWGDAGAHFLGHRFAEMDPLRWSAWEGLDSVLKDLVNQRTPQNLQRPVEIRKDGQNKVTFANLDEALRYLRAQRASGPPAEQSTASPPAYVHPTLTAAPLSPTAASKAPSRASSVGPRHTRNVEHFPDPTPYLLLALAAAVLLACCGCLGCCLLGGGKKGHKASKRKGCTDPEASGESSSDEPLCADQSRSAAIEDSDLHTAQSRRGAPQKGAEQERELQRLLLEIEGEAPHRALPSPQGQALPLDPARRAEAQQEVERILAARDLSALLGEGSPAQRRSEYRRLVRMLHPDKGLVSGERATLALRRIVEYQATLSVGE